MESTIASNVESALSDLLRKYGFTRGELELREGIELIDSRLGARQVPLLTWRGVRKFVELRNILQTGTIEGPCLLRFAAFSSRGDRSFKALLYRELDLIEYITGRRIVSVNACLTGDETGNVIAITDNGILCSIEAGIGLPPGRAPIERHELIARRGTACDVVVDTQVPAHSVYSYTEGGEATFTDGDMELFDHPYDQIDFIRSAFSVITTPSLASQWREQHQRLSGLLGAVYLSNKERRKIHLSN